MAREPWPVNSSTAWTHPITHPIERQTAKGAYQASTNGGMRHTVGISTRSTIIKALIKKHPMQCARDKKCNSRTLLSLINKSLLIYHIDRAGNDSGVRNCLRARDYSPLASPTKMLFLAYKGIMVLCPETFKVSMSRCGNHAS